MSFLITTYVQQQNDPCSPTTSYGLRFYEEGLFSTPTNFSSSHSSFPDLARWRHTLENIPEMTDINKALLLFPCSPDDHALMTSSAGWRHWLETAYGPGKHWRTALETHHTSEPQWPVVLYAARRFNSTVELWCHTGLWCHNWDLSSSLENNWRRDVITMLPLLWR